MKTSIRIMGIATSAFWVFLIVFSTSAIYSMKDVQFSLGEPQISPNGAQELLFSFPGYVVNTGLYDLAQFNVSTKISYGESSLVGTGSTFLPVVKHGQTVKFTHNVTVNLTNLLQTQQNFLFNDSELQVNNSASVRVAEMVPVQASSNFSMSWGAPLYNLVLRTPQPVSYNATHARVLVPTSFDNHAFFDVAGTVQLLIYNNTNSPISRVQTSILVAQHTSYQGNLEFYVPLLSSVRPRFEILFVTTYFSYGPLVIPFGS